MPGKECLGVPQPRRRDEGVSTLPQRERTTTEATYPVADLVADYSAEDSEKKRVAEIEDLLVDQRPGGDQDDLTGQRHPGALEHHAEEDHQVAVPADQVKQIAQNRYAAARVFMARLTSTARISSESNACTIIRTFARRLRNAVSVGLKAVLVLKARKR